MGMVFTNNDVEFTIYYSNFLIVDGTIDENYSDSEARSYIGSVTTEDDNHIIEVEIVKLYSTSLVHFLIEICCPVQKRMIQTLQELILRQAPCLVNSKTGKKKMGCKYTTTDLLIPNSQMNSLDHRS